MSSVKTVVTLDAVKGLAKQLKSEFRASGHTQKYTECLNMAARTFGYRDWHACEGSIADRDKMLRDRAIKSSKRVRLLSDTSLRDWIKGARQQTGRPCFNLDEKTRLESNVIAHLCQALDGFDEKEELSAIATLMARSGQALGRSARIVDMDSLSDLQAEDRRALSEFLGREFKPGRKNRFGCFPDKLDLLYDIISDPVWSLPASDQELIISLNLYAVNQPYLRRFIKIASENGIRFLLHYHSSVYRTGFDDYMSGESSWSGLLGCPITNGELLGTPQTPKPRMAKRVRVRRGMMSMSFHSDPETGLQPVSTREILDKAHFIAHVQSWERGDIAFTGASSFFAGDPDLQILRLDREFLFSETGADLWSRAFGSPPPSGGIKGLIFALSHVKRLPGGGEKPILWVDTGINQDADLVDDLDELAAQLRRSDVRLILSLWQSDIKHALVPRLYGAFDGWLVDRWAELPVCDPVFPGGYGSATNKTGTPLVLRKSDIEALISEPEPVES